MKLSLNAPSCFAAALILSSSLFPTHSTAGEVPSGKLNITHSSVQVGSHPIMTWSIEYPSSAEDMAAISPDHSLYLKDHSRVQVRVVGGHYSYNTDKLRMNLWMQVNNGSWATVFAGEDDWIDPEANVVDKKIARGKEIDFRAMGATPHNEWTSDYVSGIALRNGDKLPEVVTRNGLFGISAYLSQYVSSENRVVLGSREVLYLFELGGDYDRNYQDLAVIVTLGPYK